MTGNLPYEVDATAEFVTTGRGRTREPNPFDELVTQTYANAAPMAIKVPTDDANKVYSQITAAAQFAGLGVAIQLQDLKGNVLQRDELREKDGQPRTFRGKTVRVVFQGKDRRKYTPRDNGQNASE